MKGSTHPLPGFCDAEGPGLAQVVGHYQETHGVNGDLRTNSRTFARAPHLEQRPYWIEECFGGKSERAVRASR